MNTTSTTIFTNNNSNTINNQTTTTNTTTTNNNNNSYQTSNNDRDIRNTDGSRHTHCVLTLTAPIIPASPIISRNTPTASVLTYDRSTHIVAVLNDSFNSNRYDKDDDDDDHDDDDEDNGEN